MANNDMRELAFGLVNAGATAIGERAVVIVMVADIRPGGHYYVAGHGSGIEQLGLLDIGKDVIGRVARGRAADYVGDKSAVGITMAGGAAGEVAPVSATGVGGVGAAMPEKKE